MNLKPEELIAKSRQVGDESQKAWNAITDKRRVWMAFVVVCVLAFLLGAMVF